MNYSIFWARLLGIYALIIALGMYLDLKNYQALLGELAHNPIASIIMGLFTLFLGLAVLVTHQVWKKWPIIVTLLGYWLTFKGILLSFFPQVVNHAVIFWQNKNILFAPVPALFIGLILLYFGFFYKKKVV